MLDNSVVVGNVKRSSSGRTMEKGGSSKVEGKAENEKEHNVGHVLLDLCNGRRAQVACCGDLYLKIF